MIKYNSKTLNNWNFGATNIIKVYRNNAIVFYKVSGGSPTPEYKVCYAVVDDITKYSSREFIDVYDNKTNKWYKLNNINEYEEYGVYGSGRDITYYQGKLTIDDGYEYEWNGSEWVNVGELIGTSKIIKSPEYIERTSTYNGYCSLLEYLTEDTKFIIKHRQTNGGGGRIIGDYNSNDHDDWRFFFFSSTLYYDFITERKLTNKSIPMSEPEEWEVGNYYIKDTASGVNLITGTTQTFSSRPDHLYIYHSGGVGAGESGSDYGQIWYIKIYKNNVLVRDFIPWTDMNGNYGLYDKVNGETVQTVGQMTASTTINDVEVGTLAYPLHYDEKQDPLNNLSFESLDAAQEYAYNNCVYDGMKATIGVDRYYFDSTNANGWVKILEYYKVEDVTPDGASGWTISGSSTYNPDSSYYDDFDLETTSTSNSYKIAKVTIYGYDHFTYYLRSYHGWSLTQGYVMATNVDEVSTPPSEMSYDSQSAITNTYEFNKSPKSAVNLSNYRRVTYNNLDKTVEHTFYVYFYGRTYSSRVGNATILIPKEQTNENWEQVTFSASSNVAVANKNLYIDGTYEQNGGTSRFYYRWMIGLPSGSHTSYTDYSYYDYCPNVSSSTFTSVAGEQRQVNFTYDETTNKTLSFRLVDSNGNVLTPSDTVYYKLKLYNSCNASKNYMIQLPISMDVKVGGMFRFDNLYNQHYIYGYEPPELGTNYYSDDYKNTFDIVYTKLSDEAVTITYTTYDQNDSETPAFNTDITYPYNGGTTSSTTLTSFDVPYTYQYEVIQTNAKLSADSQSYTAGQTTRTINLVLYPNNREFSTVADMESYTYAWEGMNANVGDTKYKYKNGEWAEITEYFTVDLNSQWQNSTSYGSLSSDTANYDFYESFGNYNVNNGKATMFITIGGYANFTFKVRNYSKSEGNYDYVVVNNLDDTTVPSWHPSVGSGTASSGKVYYTNKGKSSNTTWYDVTFNDLDKGEHIITVTYGKDSNVNDGDDRGYVAIPKKQ